MTVGTRSSCGQVEGVTRVLRKKGLSLFGAVRTTIQRCLASALLAGVVIFGLVGGSASAAGTATALQFNGTSQYVTFGAAPGLGASTFTLETWFKRTGAGVGTSTGCGGIASAIPLITKGRAEAESSNVDMNYFLGIDAAIG